METKSCTSCLSMFYGFRVPCGKSIKKTVLSRGLRRHVEDRVLVCGDKTIVFR